MQFSLNVLNAFLNHIFFNTGISSLVTDLFTVLILTSTFFGFCSIFSIAFIPFSSFFNVIVLHWASRVNIFFSFFLLIILNFFWLDIFGFSLTYCEDEFLNFLFFFIISKDMPSIRFSICSFCASSSTIVGLVLIISNVLVLSILLLAYLLFFDCNIFKLLLFNGVISVFHESLCCPWSFFLDCDIIFNFVLVIFCGFSGFLYIYETGKLFVIFNILKFLTTFFSGDDWFICTAKSFFSLGLCVICQSSIGSISNTNDFIELFFLYWTNFLYKTLFLKYSTVLTAFFNDLCLLFIFSFSISCLYLSISLFFSLSLFLNTSSSFCSSVIFCLNSVEGSINKETLLLITISNIWKPTPSSAVSGCNSFCIIIFSFNFITCGSSIVVLFNFSSLSSSGNFIILTLNWLSIILFLLTLSYSV